MLDSALQGLILATQWPTVGYMGLGILLGLYFGAVPGLSGLVGMAILLPFTFGMDPVSAFAFLLGMYAVTTTSDSIPAVLIGVPGTAAGQATVLDGHPMAKRGEATRAFGAVFTCSAIGGVLGAILMGVSIPIVEPLVLSFAKPEIFMLGVLGVTMVGSLSGSSILKGVLSAFLGLMLSMIGYAEQMAIPRYWMGMPNLLDGVPLVVMVLGVFALPEAVMLAVRKGSISDVPAEASGGGFLTGMKDVVRHRWLLLRSSLLGTYIGVLPGVTAVADWVGYGHAVQSARDKSQFGRGDVRGVIAPEAANNSVKGGELVPTVAFGIPGSAPMAILLGAFLIQGLTPGPEMLTSQLPLTYSMMWTLVIANIAAAVLLALWTKQLQRIIFLPGAIIVPGIVVFIYMGSWSAGTLIGDWVLLLVFGLFGIAMRLGGWPRAPLVLGFILGPIMENSLFLSIRAYGADWITRPICLVLAAIVLLTLFFIIRNRWRNRGSKQLFGKAEEDDGMVSVIVSAICLAIFMIAIVGALGWPRSVSLFPLAIAGPGLVLSVMALSLDTKLIRTGGPFPALSARDEVMWIGVFFLWLAAIIAGTVLVGQLIALPVFVVLFLLVWAKVQWWFAVGYAAVCWIFLYVMFGRVIGTIWYPSILFG